MMVQCRPTDIGYCAAARDDPMHLHGPSCTRIYPVVRSHYSRLPAEIRIVRELGTVGRRCPSRFLIGGVYAGYSLVPHPHFWCGSISGTAVVCGWFVGCPIKSPSGHKELPRDPSRSCAPRRRGQQSGDVTDSFVDRPWAVLH